MLHPLLAMNAPRLLVARKVTTSVVALGYENLPDELLFLTWCRSVSDKSAPTKLYCADGMARDRPSYPYISIM